MTYRVLANAVHFKEFYGGYHGTCGETALATALVCCSPQAETEQEAINLMLSMTHEMIGLGWADASGATTTQRLYDEAKRRGFTPDDASFISYANPLDLTRLHALLLSTAGIKPIIIEISRAYALPGDEAGVDFHFICVVGITDAGYICNDGDNRQIEQSLVTYSWAQIQAASPCGVLVIEGAISVGIPSGWTDDGSALHNPQNSNVVVRGFRDWILSHPWNPASIPLDNEQSVSEVEEFTNVRGAGTRQHFRFDQLSWTTTSGVFVTWIGDELMYLLAHQSAPVDKSSLTAALSAAAAGVAQAQAALANLP